MRRQNDFYPTPEWATKILVEEVKQLGDGSRILECCSGEKAIARALPNLVAVDCNDIDQKYEADYHFDASRDWPSDLRPHDWVVTNPPFNLAHLIVPRAFSHSLLGIAMLLRLSYLEPVMNRGHWLREHPPTKMIVLPRISFTGDGKTDSVTCAWMVWEHRASNDAIVIAENPRPIRPSSRSLIEAGVL